MNDMKLLSSHIEDQFNRPLGEIVSEMNELNCGSWSMSLSGKDEKPVTAIIVVTGEHTQSVLDKIHEDDDDDE